MGRALGRRCGHGLDTGEAVWPRTGHWGDGVATDWTLARQVPWCDWSERSHGGEASVGLFQPGMHSLCLSGALASQFSF